MIDIFAIYKPKGPTSNDMVQLVKRKLGVKKVGHAGTLDPLATGVLVIGVGREATRQLAQIVKKEKEYIAKIKFGENSTTDDEEGKKVKIKIAKIPTTSQVKAVVEQFQGNILQLPPIYSAVKIKGKKAYKLARAGEKVELKHRQVEIKKIKILNYQWPYLKLQVITGPGVYIRALARDIGEKLGVGGYLADLERVRVGDFTKNDVILLEKI